MSQSHIFIVLVTLVALIGVAPPGVADENRGSGGKHVSGREAEGPPRGDSKTEDSPPPPKFSPPMPGLANEKGEGSEGGAPVSATRTETEAENGTSGTNDADGAEEPVTKGTSTAETGNLVSEGGNAAEGGEGTRRPVVHGRLDIVTEPEGARVTISVVGGDAEQAAGVSPLPLRLPANQYRVTLEKEGFETAVAEVIVEEGRVARLRVKLEPGRSGGEKGLRLAGHILFWPGLATAVTGIALLVADNPNEDINTGKAGFAVAGVGVAMTVLGGIFLGVTHRDTSVYTIPPVAVGSTPDGAGGALIFQKSF